MTDKYSEATDGAHSERDTKSCCIHWHCCTLYAVALTAFIIVLGGWLAFPHSPGYICAATIHQEQHPQVHLGQCDSRELEKIIMNMKSNIMKFASATEPTGKDSEELAKIIEDLESHFGKLTPPTSQRGENIASARNPNEIESCPVRKMAAVDKSLKDIIENAAPSPEFAEHFSKWFDQGGRRGISLHDLKESEIGLNVSNLHDTSVITALASAFVNIYRHELEKVAEWTRIHDGEAELRNAVFSRRIDAFNLKETLKRTAMKELQRRIDSGDVGASMLLRAIMALLRDALKLPAGNPFELQFPFCFVELDRQDANQFRGLLKQWMSHMLNISEQHFQVAKTTQCSKKDTDDQRSLAAMGQICRVCGDSEFANATLNRFGDISVLSHTIFDETVEFVLSGIVEECDPTKIPFCYDLQRSLRELHTSRTTLATKRTTVAVRRRVQEHEQKENENRNVERYVNKDRTSISLIRSQ